MATDLFGEPFADTFGDPFAEEKKPDLGELENIKALAEQYGYKKEEPTSALKTIGKVLTFFPRQAASVAAGAYSATHGGTYSGGRQRFLQKDTSGFTDLFKQIAGKPETGLGKGLLWTAGFAADVAFDPITYLTFGLSGAGKTVGVNVTKEVWNPAIKAFETKIVPETYKLTTEGVRIMDSVRNGYAQSWEKQLLREGTITDPVVAAKKARDYANNEVKMLIEKEIIANKGLSDKAFQRIVDRGIERNTVEELRALAPNLIDKGGINLFSKRMVDYSTIKESALGKAISKVYKDGGLAQVTHYFTDPVLDAFVYGFAKNPKILNLLARTGFNMSHQQDALQSEIKTIFSGLNKEEKDQMGDIVLGRKFEQIDRANEIQKGIVDEVSKINPVLARHLEKGTVAQKNSIAETVEAYQEKVLRPMHERMVTLAEKEKEWASSSTAELIERADKLELDLVDLKKEYKTKHSEFLVGSRIQMPDGEGKFITPSDESYDMFASFVDSIQKEAALARIDKAIESLEKIKGMSKIATTPAEIESTIKETGAVFRGLQDAEDGGKLVLFDDPATKSTLAIEANIVSQENILAKLSESRKKFGVTEGPFKGKIIATKKMFDEAALPSKEVDDIIGVREIVDKKIIKELEEKLPDGIDKQAVSLVYNKFISGPKNQFYSLPKDKFLDELGKQKQALFVQAHRFTDFDRGAILAAQIRSTENDIGKLTSLLGKYSNARRTAKAEFKAAGKVDFKNPAMNKAADDLWYSKDALMPRLARSVGIDEQDMYQEYAPTLLREHMEMRQPFLGNWGFNKGLGKTAKLSDIEAFKKRGGITDIEELVKTRGKAIVSLRIKASALESASRTLGRRLESMTEAVAEKRGWVQFIRDHPIKKGLDGKPAKIGGWFPKEVASELETMWKSKADANPFKTYDYMTSLWKSWLTAPWPAFHILNLSSNQIQNMMRLGSDFFNPRLQKMSAQMAAAGVYKKGTFILNRKLHESSKKALQKSSIFTKNGQEINAWKLLRQIKKEYPDIFQSTFMQQDTLADAPEAIQKLSKWLPFDPLNNRFLSGARSFGNTIENQSKLLAIITQVEAGKSIKDGIKIAEETIFNYGKLTPFEKSIMKRIIPFYTFARKNAELQVKMLAKYPGRMAMQYKLFNSLDSSLSEMYQTDDETGLPQYVANSFGFNATTDKGNRYVTGFGLPLEEFLGRLSGDNGIMWNAVKNTIAQTNPFVKMPIEMATGIDLYRGRPIVEINNPDEFTSMLSSMPGPVGDAFKNLFEIHTIENVPIYMNGLVVGHKNKMVANPYSLWLIRNLPTSRLQNTLSKAIESEKDQVAPTRAAVGLAGVTGIDVVIPDAEKERFFKGIREYEAIGDWLDRLGVVNKYQTYYKPKTEEEKMLEESTKIYK